MFSTFVQSVSSAGCFNYSQVSFIFSVISQLGCRLIGGISLARARGGFQFHPPLYKQSSTASNPPASRRDCNTKAHPHPISQIGIITKNNFVCISYWKWLSRAFLITRNVSIEKRVMSWKYTDCVIRATCGQMWASARTCLAYIRVTFFRTSGQFWYSNLVRSRFYLVWISVCVWNGNNSFPWEWNLIHAIIH